MLVREGMPKVCGKLARGFQWACDLMELEKLEKNGDEGGRRVLFDILKEWTSASFHRQVRDTSPPGCAWQSLAMAFQEAKGSGEVTDVENAMRRLLVQAYGSLSKEQCRAVAAAKLECRLSFFHHTKYREVDRVLEHWNWYLYCLTFCSQSFSDQCRWANTLEEPVQGVFVVRMQLDSVDLYFFAKLMRLRILLLQFCQPALQFGDNGVTLHLVSYGGMWAPLLSTKLWLQEKADLSGSIVQIDSSLKGSLAPFAGKTACVLGYDVDKDYHIAATTRLFPLKSVQISEIIARSEDRNITFWRHHSRHDEPPLHGIPDKAVEFQILLHLLQLVVGQRLEELHEVLAGRCPRPRELQEDLVPWEDFVSGREAVQNSGSRDRLWASSLPLQEVVAMLFEGKRVWTKCLVPVGPQPDKLDFLTCRVQDFICLEQVVEMVDEHDDKFSEVTFLAYTASDKQAKLLSSDAVCSWLVLHDFLPDQSHQRFRQLAKLHEGETAIVTERRRGKWNGWARGRVIASSQSDDVGEGDFKLALLRPQIWIARIEPAERYRKNKVESGM